MFAFETAGHFVCDYFSELLEIGSGARWTNQPPDVRIGYPPSTTPLFFISAEHYR